jgi:hypothetical protein
VITYTRKDGQAPPEIFFTFAPGGERVRYIPERGARHGTAANAEADRESEHREARNAQATAEVAWSAKKNQCLREALAAVIGVEPPALPPVTFQETADRNWAEIYFTRLRDDYGVRLEVCGTEDIRNSDRRWIAVVPSTEDRGAGHAIACEGLSVLVDPAGNRAPGTPAPLGLALYAIRVTDFGRYA